ncbi:unnamed protein product [Pipistrellus nathusii]|uniref:BHLH domain-containing protein n=1 Tax=Pipistrellus nathusii TaxID=59473 RepID=A0ABP0AH70_PIPNA
MSGGAPPRTPAPALGVPGGSAARRPASPELLRCGRRRRPEGPGGGAGAGAGAAVARRNARERSRVRRVNLGFQALRQHVPRGGRRLSKAETLRSAAAYIRALQRLLAEQDGGLLAPSGGPPAAAPPSGGSSEPGSPRSACSSDGSGGEGAPSPAERELLGFPVWLGGC